ncbi:MAG: manganese efflux pump [Clostridia bacterium]|nr:manganese efflux pump [Clostridia bacterium]
MWDFSFFFSSVMLGVGLAMDAFSVSIANGLNEPRMKRHKQFGIAGIFAFFQFLMPLLGWLCVHNFVKLFSSFEPFIPWIALALLGFIGGKMLVEGIRHKESQEEPPKAGLAGLLIQGIATSIDALSVGFTISEYDGLHALICGLLIAAVTFVICSVGVSLGKTVGTRLSGKASILGGSILIIIGIMIFVRGVF